jgi:putative ABC transport system ATP-binding protein
MSKQASNGQQTSSHLIYLRNVVKTYETEAGDFPALRGIDLTVERGEFVSVIGKSGSGKTTMINMITGIDKPTSGEVYVSGTRIDQMKEDEMSRWRGNHLGIVFQFFQLLPTLTVVENVMLPMDFCRLWTPRERYDRSMHLLAQVDIAEHAFKLPSEVSGGQQQRVAIARSLATDPDIICADEPTGNLDSRTADGVFELFENFVNQGKTILLVTHDQMLSERTSRTLTIVDGIVYDSHENGGSTS